MPSDAGNLPTLAIRRPQTGRKYFTLAEANRALPYIARIAEDLHASYRDMMDVREQLQDAPSQGREHLEAAYEASMDRLSGYMDELQAVGVDLKDFELVLIDFPAVVEDREICLCWKRGEAAVTHWHETNAGFAGRQPVEGSLPLE